MKKTGEKRIDWIDALRGLAMFFVVWGHCFLTNKHFIRRYIYSFHMPLFFFISGLTFLNNDKISLKEFVKKRVRGLIIPYIVVNIVCYIISALLFEFKIIKSFSYLNNFLGIFVSQDELFNQPSCPSWFLITLFLVEIFFFFLKKHSKSDFDLLKSVSICGLIGYANSISGFQFFVPFHIDTVFTGVVFYYIGYVFMKNIKKFDFILNDKLRMLSYGMVCGAFAIIISCYNRRVSMHANLYGSITLFYLSSLLSIFGFILFVNIFLKKSKVFKNIGKNTVFYLAYQHIFIDIVACNYSKIMKSNFSVFIFAIVLTALMYPLALLIKKYIPILIGKVNIKALN